MGLLLEWSTQKAVDKQKWMFTANLKDKTSWKKSYVECTVGLP